jgi:hypothetical protein
MLDAFKAGGDFHSRTAVNMYPHIREAIEKKRVLLEWYPQPGEDKPPVPLLKVNCELFFEPACGCVSQVNEWDLFCDFCCMCSALKDLAMFFYFFCALCYV